MLDALAGDAEAPSPPHPRRRCGASSRGPSAPRARPPRPRSSPLRRPTRTASRRSRRRTRGGGRSRRRTSSASPARRVGAPPAAPPCRPRPASRCGGTASSGRRRRRAAGARLEANATAEAAAGQAISSFSAARTSASGTSTPHRGLPGASRSTSRGVPRSTFLSRASAARRRRHPRDKLPARGSSPPSAPRRRGRRAERREEPERDRAAVREPVAGGGLERVRERVPEVELVPRSAIVRIGEAEPDLNAAHARTWSSSERSQSGAPAGALS